MRTSCHFHVLQGQEPCLTLFELAAPHVAFFPMTSCHGGDNAQCITVLYGRLCSTSKADILIIEVQIDAFPDGLLAIASLCPYVGKMPF